MWILDLFSGGGGAARGFLRHPGVQVVGIDNNPKLTRYYPGDFYARDAFTIPVEYMNQFDLVWASPPCTLYSGQTSHHHVMHEDTVRMFKRILQGISVPYVIENVPEAPVRNDLMLCGKMFGLPLIRHRVFEIHGFSVPQPEDPPHTGEVYTVTGHTGGRKSGKQSDIERSGMKSDWQRAMDIYDMSTRTMAQAIPPAYSEYILTYYLDEIPVSHRAVQTSGHA